ncbi:MAG: hypothetical protein EOO88_42950 [Pedobacter sp.]|nr:MAG: hypothetical protein EOO88_42950 [Pedobacter sp.]
MRLFQKDAYIGIDFLAKKTEIIKLKESGDQNVFAFDLETSNGVKKTVAIANPEIKDSNAILSELQSFIIAIQEDRTTAVSEIDGMLAIETAHLILEKMGQLTDKPLLEMQ